MAATSATGSGITQVTTNAIDGKPLTEGLGTAIIAGGVAGGVGTAASGAAIIKEVTKGASNGV